MKKDYSEILRRDLVGSKLKEWRISANLSQNDTAKKLKYSSPQFISNWERGVSLPPLEILPKLMKLYGFSAEELTKVMFEYQEKQLAYQHSQLVDILKNHS